SFDIDEATARRSDNRMFVAYLRTFARMGLKAIPMRAETGPIGGDVSHELIVLAETGESGVFCNRDVLNLPIPPDDVDYDGDLTDIIKQWTSVYAATEDVHDAERYEREVPADKRVNTRGIEVGQIFYFGTKYSDAMKALVAGADGVDVPYDDTDQRAGAKFAAADLIGIPWQILVGPKGLAEGKLEIKRRSDGSRENLSPAEVVAKIAGT